MFCSKMHNFDSTLQIFTRCIEQVFRHLHINYLSDQMILKGLHKMHKIINILEFDKF